MTVETTKAGRKRWLLAGVATAALLLVIVGILGLYIWLTQPPIPRSIVNELDFSPMVLVNNQSGRMWVTNYTYDKETKLFSFILHRQPNESFTFSEQSTPSEFSDVPDFYQKLLDKLNSYSTVQTFNGAVNLTKPPGGTTTGIVVTQKGVLMFIKSTGAEPSQDDWRSVVESLDIYKIQN